MAKDFLSEVLHECKQQSKGQDFITCGDSLNVSWLVCIDGHGSNTVINACRSFNWHIAQDEQLLSLWSMLNLHLRGMDTSMSGATLIVVRLHKKEPAFISIEWIGDSQCAVYQGGKELLRCGNSYEIHPIIKSRISREETTKYRVIDNDNMVEEIDYMFNFGSQECINMTGALGHNQLTYHSPFYASLELKSHLRAPYTIVVGTDGFWDMTHENDLSLLSNPNVPVSDLIELASKRWNQNWDVKMKDGTVIDNGVFDRKDDCSVARMVIYPHFNTV